MDICKGFIPKLTKSITKLLMLTEVLKKKTRAHAIVGGMKEERQKQEALVKAVQQTTAKHSGEAMIANLNKAVETTLANAAILVQEAKPHLKEPK